MPVEDERTARYFLRGAVPPVRSGGHARRSGPSRSRRPRGAGDSDPNRPEIRPRRPRCPSQAILPGRRGSHVPWSPPRRARSCARARRSVEGSLKLVARRVSCRPRLPSPLRVPTRVPLAGPTAPLAALLPAALADPGLQDVVAAAGRDVAVEGPTGLRPFLAAALAAAPGEGGEVGGAGAPVLVVTATEREAEELSTAVGELLSPDEVALLPSWETLPHERLSPRADTVGRRVAVMRRLAHPEAPDTPDVPLRVVVTATRSLIQPVVPGLGDLEPVRLAEGTEYELEALTARLVDLAYARVEMVEKRGEFAVRGGIVDLFPPTAAAPVRVEFWGDEVSELRCFSVADQRSLPGDGPDARPTEVVAPPCRELLLTDTVRARAAELAAEHTKDKALAELLSRVAEGIPSEGMESLIPALLSGEGETPELALLPELLPSGGHVLVCHPERVITRAADLVRTGQEFLEASWLAAADGADGRAPIDLGASAYRDLGDVRAVAAKAGRPWWTLSSLATDPDVEDDSHTREGARVLRPGFTAVEAYRGDIARAAADLRGLAASGGIGVVVVPAAGTAQRAAEQLREHEVPVVLADEEGGPARRAAARRGHDRARVAGRRRHGRRHAAGDRHRVRPDGQPLERRRRREAGAGQAAQRRRPPHAPDGRLRRPRPARHRQVRRDDPAHHRHRPGAHHARVPRAGVRELEARAGVGPAVRPHRPARPGQPLRRRRAADAEQARRLRLVEDEVEGAQGGPRHRRVAGPALRGAPVRARARVRGRHPVAAGDGGRVPVHRDARPGVGDRRGQGRHGEGGPDGPRHLRRRRLRQDRDRGARGVQGGAGRQAGRGARADDAARPAAPADVHRPDAQLPDHGEGALAVHAGQGGRRDPPGPRRRQRRRRRRHPPAPADRGVLEGPRAGDHRRGAALRRRAQGAHHRAARPRRHAVDVGDADPAHPGDEPRRHPRDVDDPHPARGAAPDADLRRRPGAQADRRRDPARAAARRAGLLHPQPRAVDRRRRGQAAPAHPRGAHRHRARPDARGAPRAHRQRVLGARARRPGLHDDRRERPGHLQRQHPDRRARGHPGALAAPPAPRARRAAGASGGTPTSSTRPTSRSPRPRTTASPPSPSTPSWAPAPRSR